jgi:hypothetical protein
MEQCTITIISISITAVAALGALGAVVAAIGSCKSATETRKTALAQIVIQITSTYSSSDMGESVKNLHNWKKKHPEDFAQLFNKGLAEPNNITKQLDEDRRRVSHHFHQIEAMLDCGVIDEDFVRKLVKPDQVNTLLDIVEPLEKVKNPDYDHSTFDSFRRIYPKGD